MLPLRKAALKHFLGEGIFSAGSTGQKEDAFEEFASSDGNNPYVKKPTLMLGLD